VSAAQQPVAPTTLPGKLVILGHPLSHTLSPVFQNAALKAAGIPLTYEPLDIPRSVLDDTLGDLRRKRAAGNVTVPYKEALFNACDRLTDTARAVGAVNTFWTGPDGAMVGDNTDVAGFSAAAHELVGPPRDGEIVALLGAGGGAAAVLHAMEGWPNASVQLYSRTRARAEELVKRFKVPGEVARSAEDAVDGATLVINATPVGLRDDTVPVQVSFLIAGSAVLDLAYRIGETAFVRDARAKGHRAMDGLHMLVEQGAESFERWFGVKADRAAMWAALKAR
jgi:shikimate dehydrogenase